MAKIVRRHDADRAAFRAAAEKVMLLADTRSSDEVNRELHDAAFELRGMVTRILGYCEHLERVITASKETQ